MSHSHSSRALILITVLATSACGSSGGSSPTSPSTGTTPTTATLTVTITGATSGEVGSTAKLTAAAKDASGAAVTATFSWSSSDQSVISVASDGTVTATKIGSATITATATATGASGSGTATFSSNLTPYTFNLSASTSAADQQIIRDAVQYATAYYQTAFGRTVTQASTITSAVGQAPCTNGNAAAATTSRSIVFCTGNQGWTQPGTKEKTKIAMHELFHLVQFEMRWTGVATPGPTWMIEGMAELMGYRSAANRGLYASDALQGCMAKQVADFGLQQPPGLGNLDQFQTVPSFQVAGPTYALAFLGMEQLVNLSGMASVKAYGEDIGGGDQVSSAFSRRFPLPIASFYSQFPSYRASVSVPAAYNCGG